ncbi:MAG: tRNA adenosine(34) deaminase TadA [Clostridia bacterium]|nr:tRNA adenosine(34) deaminase TadA [Clostridia bacterium]
MKITRSEKYQRKRAERAALEKAEKKRVEKYMKMAIRQARLAGKKGEVPVGAVIVKDGAVISRAHNLRESKRIATAHAEILAIEKACRKVGDWRLTNAEMFVTLEPCSMCAGAVANARIKSLYFGAYERKGGACGSVHNVLENTGLNSNVNVTGGVLEEECSSAITAFFENKRNKIT